MEKKASVLRAGRWKLVLDRKAGGHVLYDILEDRQENMDVAAAHPDVVDSLLPVLQRRIETVRGGNVSPDLREIPSEEEKMLRELGYFVD